MLIAACELTSDRVKDVVKGFVLVNFCKVLLSIVHSLIRSQLLQSKGVTGNLADTSPVQDRFAYYSFVTSCTRLFMNPEMP